MNKQLEEGKRLEDDCKNWIAQVIFQVAKEEMTHIKNKIEKLEALNNLAQDIVTHPCWVVNSEIPKSLKARRDLYVEAWNALEESE